MKSRTRISLSGAVASLFACACVAPMSGDWRAATLTGEPRATTSPSSPYGAPRLSEASATPSMFQTEGEYPLYSRDGGVVDSPVPGSVRRGAPTHDVESTGPGRMYILELYQVAIEERDTLQLEVTALNHALKRTHSELDATTAAYAIRGDELVVLVRERDRLRAESEDLTARLVTAQIRRLESEKLLIESKLEWYRGLPPTPPKAMFEPTKTMDNSTTSTVAPTPGTTAAGDTMDTAPMGSMDSDGTPKLDQEG